MDIPFYLPYAFHPGSNPTDDAHVRRVLLDCLSKLERLTKVRLVKKSVNGLSCHVFELSKLFVVGRNSPSDQLANGQALNVLLEALVELNVAWLHNRNEVPLYECGVVYGRTDEWEPYPSLRMRGFGDCKSLAALKVAEYRLCGVPAELSHRWMRRQDGFVMYHILVEPEPLRQPGVYEDPSKVLGMNANEFSYFS